jgi:hypothetical protein
MRVDKNGRVCNSQPCYSCIQALRHIIHKIYYTTSDGSIKCEKVLEMKLSYITVSDQNHDRTIQTIIRNKAKTKAKL